MAFAKKKEQDWLQKAKGPSANFRICQNMGMAIFCSDPLPPPPPNNINTAHRGRFQVNVNPISESKLNGARLRWSLRWLVVLLPRQIRRFRHGFFSSAVGDWSLRSCLRVRHLWRQQIADNRRYLRRSFLPWTSSLPSQISRSKRR